MTMHDEAPWQQPETVGAQEWFDESPFQADVTTEAEWLAEPQTEWSAGPASQGFGEPAAEWLTEPKAPPQSERPCGCGQREAEHESGFELEDAVVHSCRPGEGPPRAPVGPRPLIFASGAAAISRNPSVGYAQDLLNRFLASWRGGSASCADTGAATRQYIDSLHKQLQARRQDPLVVDCRFGDSTTLAVKMFQACNGLVRDGKIGSKSWPPLEALAAAQPVPPPVPVPPVPVPPVVAGTRVRQDVWILSAAAEWHPTILWYARGIAGLQARDGTNFADPRSWRHLAEIHGASIDRAQWPAGARWDACEHGSWHFLPWHRIYLHHFERIMRDEIVRLGGPQDWALPYWDYSDTSRPEVRRLPPAFRRERTPDNRPNPLRVEQRGPGINGGGQLDENVVDATAALDQTTFSSSFAPGFGGRPGRPGTHNGSLNGSLENLPHGTVHVAVGGTSPRGFMSNFETAGRDAIFWLHHANVDRLWEAWLRRGSNRNPTDAQWLNARFDFGSGSTTTSLTTAQVLDPRQSPLGYRYADMPATATREAFEDRLDAAREPTGEWLGAQEARPPELVGASGAPVPLGSQPTTARVDVTAPTGPVARLISEAGAPPPGSQVHLRLENIVGTKLGAGSVVVHVNVPVGANPNDFPDRRAGVVSMFGVVEASQRTGQHSGSGIDVTFDITTIVRALAAAGSWDPKQLRVTFTPIPDATGAVPEGNVAVGRISLFYS